MWPVIRIEKYLYIEDPEMAQRLELLDRDFNKMLTAPGENVDNMHEETEFRNQLQAVKKKC